MAVPGYPGTLEHLLVRVFPNVDASPASGHAAPKEVVAILWRRRSCVSAQWSAAAGDAMLTLMLLLAALVV
jgi:hypothetical protein